MLRRSVSPDRPAGFHDDILVLIDHAFHVEVAHAPGQWARGPGRTLRGGLHGLLDRFVHHRDFAFGKVSRIRRIRRLGSTCQGTVLASASGWYEALSRRRLG